MCHFLSNSFHHLLYIFVVLFYFFWNMWEMEQHIGNKFLMKFFSLIPTSHIFSLQNFLVFMLWNVFVRQSQSSLLADIQVS